MQPAKKEKAFYHKVLALKTTANQSVCAFAFLTSQLFRTNLLFEKMPIFAVA
ncbi:MAG: hypothetical protein ACOYN5_08200 [Bacteroidales bacterium]